MTKESFGNAFSEACRAAGIQKSAHGLRKIGATRAANNGATVAPVAIGATQAGSDPGVSFRLCQRESGDLLIDSALASIRSQTIADRAIFQIVIGIDLGATIPWRLRTDPGLQLLRALAIFERRLRTVL
jgi:hypothetical protein